MSDDELRLFDVDTDGEASHSETITPVSRRETTSKNVTPIGVAGRVSARDDSLEERASAAAAASAATAALDDAIAAARQAGHSWRTIAACSQIPFQTLHRRARRQAQ